MVCKVECQQLVVVSPSAVGMSVRCLSAGVSAVDISVGVVSRHVDMSAVGVIRWGLSACRLSVCQSDGMSAVGVVYREACRRSVWSAIM